MRNAAGPGHVHPQEPERIAFEVKATKKPLQRVEAIGACSQLEPLVKRRAVDRAVVVSLLGFTARAKEYIEHAQVVPTAGATACIGDWFSRKAERAPVSWY